MSRSVWAGLFAMVVTCGAVVAVEAQTVSNVRWNQTSSFPGYCSGYYCLDYKTDNVTFQFEHYINCPDGPTLILDTSSRSFSYQSSCSGWECPCSSYIPSCTGSVGFWKEDGGDFWRVVAEVRSRVRVYQFSECACDGGDYLDTMTWSKVTSEQVCGGNLLARGSTTPAPVAMVRSETRSRQHFGLLQWGSCTPPSTSFLTPAVKAMRVDVDDSSR